MSTVSAESETSTNSSPARRAAFSLCTLLLVLILIGAAAALIKQRVELAELKAVLNAHDLHSTALSVDDVSIDIRKLSHSPAPLVYEIVIETLGARPLTLASDTSKSQVNIGDKGDPPALTRSYVVVVADFVARPESATNTYRYLLQLGGAHGSAGGPSETPIPKDKKLADVFELLIKPGLYARGKPVPVCTIDGHTHYLTVQ